MKGKSLDEKISILTAMVHPLIDSMEIELWGVEIVEGGRPIVRIYIEGADVEACAEISRHLALALEVEDIFTSAYVLEVSSPGFSRPFFRLAQMQPYIGQQIEVVLKEPLDDSGRRKFQGILAAVEGANIIVDLAGPDKEPVLAALPWDAVGKAKRVYIFEEKIKPGHKKSVKKNTV